MIGSSLYLGFVTAAAYIALEPHVRRHWPQSMVTWSRLLKGQFRDPLVGSHLLIGIAFFTAAQLLVVASDGYNARSGILPTYPLLNVTESSGMLDHLFSSLRSGITVAMGLFFLFFLFRVALRREWLAAAAVVLVGEFMATGVEGVLNRIAFTVVAVLLLLIIIRFGVLAIAAGFFVLNLLPGLLLITDLSVWYAATTLFGVAAILAFTVYAFQSAVGNRRLLKPDFLAPN